MDANGKPFTQSAQTCDITRMGARVKGVFCLEAAGEILGVQHGSLKARFKVMWVGRSGTAAHGEIGLRTLEPDKYIWVVADVAHGRKDGADDATVPVIAHKAVSDTAAPSGRRLYQRHTVRGTVQIRREGESAPIFGNLSDISLTGSYLETTAPLPAGSRLSLVISIQGVEVRTKAQVRSSHPNVGGGVLFTEMTVEDRDCLERLIGGFTKKVEGTAQNAGAKNYDYSLAAQMKEVSTNMKALADQFMQAKLDPRLAHHCQQSLQHAREALWVANQFMDQEGQGRHGFAVLDQVNLQRVKQARHVMKELATDIDAAELAPDAEGLNELLQTARYLLERLELLINIKSATAGR